MELTFEDEGYEIELDGKAYITCLYAEAEYSYTPGRMYMPNGDPGYPDDEELEITKVELSSVAELDTGKAVDDKELLGKIEDRVTDKLYNMDINLWSGVEEDCEDEEDTGDRKVNISNIF